MDDPHFPINAWFAGPKSENSEAFAQVIQRILQDHQYWRRNYYPEDGLIVTSERRRAHSLWNDQFEDRLFELLAALKADFPFHSPRYAAHMLAEQTLPSIAAYFAAMLYNPNNVSTEAAPVTVRLEREAGRLLVEMLGYDGATSWSHLTSGGTVANLEALWVARTVKYLPFLLRDVLVQFERAHPLREAHRDVLLGMPPQRAMALLLEVFDEVQAYAGATPETTRRFIDAYRKSPYNVMQVGMRTVCDGLDSEPVLVVPETYHYSLPKVMDLLGLGHRSVVSVPVDHRFRMLAGDLRDTLDRVEQEGKHILAVVAIVGSTEEGAVDPVDEIVALREEREAAGRPSFWLHADAAYGGYLRTTIVPEREGLGNPWTETKIRGEAVRLDLNLPENATCDALEQLGTCDSIVIDPHKLGYIPYPAGAVCFKSNLVRPLVRQNAPYIGEEPQGPRAEIENENIGLYILEGSKPGAAAAAVWLSHTLIPLDTRGHGKLVRQTIRNACELYTLLDQWPLQAGPQSMQAVPLCPPQSNIVCYAFRPAEEAVSLQRINALNRALYRHFSLSDMRRLHVYDQNFFVSRTMLNAERYGPAATRDMLQRLGVSDEEFEDQGLFLLRSTLMNPWYEAAKQRNRHYLVGLVDELYTYATQYWQEIDEETTEVAG